MATSDLDDFKFEKENYDRLLAVFHIGTDVKRYLLEYLLSQNHLNLLDWLTNINKNFLQFEDIKRARKRSSKIKPADLGVNTVDTVLKYNCFDLFWDSCLKNTSLEDILNNHKDELYRIYRNSNRNYAGPSMSTQYSSQCLTKDQWEVLFKTEKHMVMDPEGGENNIFASPGLTLSCLDSNLNVLILNIVCPLYKSVNAVSECQIRISKTAVFEYEIETPVFEDIWNKIETHILLIGIHCRLSDHFRRKCTAVKQATFNKTLAQENRKIILEEGFNNPDLVNDSQLCDHLQKELELIAFEDTLYYEETLCSNEVIIPLVDGKYRTGAYTECVLQKAEKDLQVCKSLCATTDDTNEMGDLNKKKEKDGIQERINRHNHLKLVQLITDTARDVLVEILKIRLPGCDFGQAFIGMKKRILPHLNNNERQLLYPDNAKYSGDLNDLDITVLYVILRNISTICPHQNGWGHTPEDNDRSVSANIDRIRIMKNKFVSHSSTYSLTETEFLTTWKEIRQCIIELGGNDYTKRIDYLLTSEINPVIENELSIALEKLKESDQERARMYINFEERFQSYQQELNMHKKKRFKKTRASECSGTVPVQIRISGDIVPSANGIIPADFASEDLCVNSFKDGSLIIDLDISRSAIWNVGYFLNVIDMLLSALLQRDPAPVMDSSKYVIVSMEFPSYTYTKENLQTSDIYKTEQSVKRQKKNNEDINHLSGSLKKQRSTLPNSAPKDLDATFVDYDRHWNTRTTLAHEHKHKNEPQLVKIRKLDSVTAVDREIRTNIDVQSTVIVGKKMTDSKILEEIQCLNEKWRKKEVLKADQNETQDEMQIDDKQKRINKLWYLKVVQLILNIAKYVLVNILIERLPGPNFRYALNAIQNRIRPFLNNHECQLLYPDGSSYSGDLSDLDIRLIYIILRNLNTIVPHSNFWGHLPNDDDRSVSANIERIRIFNNMYVNHYPHRSLDKHDFLLTWQKIRQCIIELGGAEYKSKIDSLLTTEINPLMEHELFDTLKRLKETEKERQNEWKYMSLEERMRIFTQDMRSSTMDIPAAKNASLGSVPLELRIEGDDIPSVEKVKQHIKDWSNDDIQITYVEEGSIIFGLKVSTTAIHTVGKCIGMIDTLFSKILQIYPHYENGHTPRIVASLNFMDEQNVAIGFPIVELVATTEQYQLTVHELKTNRDKQMQRSLQITGEQDITYSKESKEIDKCSLELKKNFKDSEEKDRGDTEQAKCQKEKASFKVL